MTYCTGQLKTRKTEWREKLELERWQPASWYCDGIVHWPLIGREQEINLNLCVGRIMDSGKYGEAGVPRQLQQDDVG